MTKRNRYVTFPPTENFDGVRFANPGHPGTDRSVRDLFRWQRERRVPWPKRVDIVRAVPERRVSGLRATMVGHATVLIQAAGLNVLTDPVWSERAGPYGYIGRSRTTAPGIAFADLPPIDVVLLSHNHYDHLDLPTLKRLHERDAPMIITPLGNETIIRRAVPRARIATGNWGTRFHLPNGAVVDIVPANHWSARGIGDRRMALWGGFMLKTNAGLVYFAGDTGYGTGAIFKAMRATHGRPDLALIPIGAYAPRWFMAAQHVDPKEAVLIMRSLDARKALGIHWGTFRLTDEPWDEPPRLLAEALASHGMNRTCFEAFRPGQVVDVDPRQDSDAGSPN
ncbi:L-ascorbate metabolism protein UlaG (beta-lactamase superfamily) [Rhizobium sp. BK226]|uniref:MBL fold metallo-hydrolase n=1 Tax=Rhizobium sp. BK226 TaxID=2587075 RepID=UPI00160A74EC|nr:MBL fold metallo-hydrolase [Rhizobium sp. BK226]MBB4113232.1 L-ascorbate metabolism protein UlaG (beta-lactamase superfamily) [Rhizobium sp. BK226]